MKNSILPLALFASSVPLVHAATLIDFESPYTIGALSSTPGTTTNRPFDGQQGWSKSTSGNGGQIITTTTSGSYAGSQALTGSTAASAGSADTYIGGKSIGPMTSLVFDFRYYGVELGIGGWNDTVLNPAFFDQSEAQFMAGIVATSGTTYGFGLRGAGFLSTGGNYNGRFSTGTTGTVGDWYRMTVTPDFANLQVSLAVYNLTTSAAVTLATSTFTLTGAQFGVDPAAYEGISARVTSHASAPAVLDNINVIPEPAAALLGGLGMLSLLRRRRG